MATGGLAVLERPAVDAPYLRVVPSIEEASKLPLEYQFEPISHDAYRIPWLANPISGIIHAGQVWFIVDDGKHANPVQGEMIITFDLGSIPIVEFDKRATQSLHGFLRDILAGNAWYVKDVFRS